MRRQFSSPPDVPIAWQSGDSGIPTSVPPSVGSSDFRQLGMLEAIASILCAQHITSPTIMQVVTSPNVLAGKDALTQALIGSGETLVFGTLLVALSKDVFPALPGYSRALIISPIRELVDQIVDVLADTGAATGLRILSLVDDGFVVKQQTLFAVSVDIAMIIPGRTHDLCRRGVFSLKHVLAVVVDEADTSVDVDFLSDVLSLVCAYPKVTQRMASSATINDDTAGLIRDCCTRGIEIARHKVTISRLTMRNMRHLLLRMEDNAEVDEVVAWVASRKSRYVIFVNPRTHVMQLAKLLQFYDIKLGFLHGDRNRATRRAILKAFADGEINVFVTTNVAARGTDINALDLVVHMDPPRDFATYTRRLGRTARVGVFDTMTMTVRSHRAGQVRELLAGAGAEAEKLRAAPGPPRPVRELGTRCPHWTCQDQSQSAGGASGAGYRRRGGPSASGKNRVDGRVYCPKCGEKKKR